MRPFSCGVCQRSFARQDALKRHARVHRNGPTVGAAPLEPLNTAITTTASTSSSTATSAGATNSATTTTPSGTIVHVAQDLATDRSPPSAHIPPDVARLSPSTGAAAASGLPYPHESDVTSSAPQPFVSDPYPVGSGVVIGGGGNISGPSPLDSRTEMHSSGSLIWPDSEDLLQTIMQLNPMLWEQPIAFMPLAQEPFLNMSSAPGESGGAGMGGAGAGIPRTDTPSQNPQLNSGYGAIQTLNGLIKTTVSRFSLLLERVVLRRNGKLTKGMPVTKCLGLERDCISRILRPHTQIPRQLLAHVLHHIRPHVPRAAPPHIRV